jgi:phospholipase C
MQQATDGTLPQVSWVIADEPLSERPLHRPQDGAWQQLQIIEAITSGDSMNSTALFVSYDGKYSICASNWTLIDL